MSNEAYWREKYEQLKAQRQWVGLTDDEINSVAYNNHPLDGIRTFARAMEAKLKQKNGYAEEKNT